MESSRPSTITKRLLHIARVVYYMLRKGISKGKLTMDLHLLLKRGKIAGKALTNLLMTFHHHHHHHQPAANSQFRSKEVQFSCSNTPSYHSNYFQTDAKCKGRSHRSDYSLDMAAMAKAFELMNADTSDAETSVASSATSSAFPTPSPMLYGLGRSPMFVRKLRITDSPFPVQDDGAAGAAGIDKEAEEFIKKFYEQLRWQQLACATATPEHGYRRRS